jgi:DNA-binding MarR family transcriptional regulator/N-acetylglutamate synthase-like GNAT family acetyltransferase
VRRLRPAVREPERNQRVHAIRHFNRFYTRRIGVLQDQFLQSEYSLTEVRVLFELSRAERSTSRDIAVALDLDPGYLSRILRHFQRAGLLQRATSPQDRREVLLSLSAAGRRIIGELDARSTAAIGDLLRGLPEGEQQRLLGAMRTIEELLDRPGEPRLPYVLRPLHAGDAGWVLQRHGALYAEAYGWNERFEALVGRILSDFLLEHDSRRERGWIAEREGQNVGCVFLVRKTDRVAKLRMLLVEPSARNLGIGTRLVAEVITFARQAGYHRLTLWTNDVLVDARRIYERAGFQLADTEKNDEFGRPTVSQNWDLDLRAPRKR